MATTNSTAMTKKDVSEAMRDIDICMMTTMSTAGAHESRPMSNNRDVDWDGDSYFFAYDHSSAARDIAAHPSVNLAYVHQKVLGKDMYISLEGEARLVKEKGELAKHWQKSMAAWFPEGLDTPGIVMIAVKASRVTWWKGFENGEIRM